MAVCGRCWLCGTVFSCNLRDVGAVVRFTSEEAYDGDLNDGGRKLCTSCVQAIDGDLFPDDRNEPHGDGVPPVERLAQIIGLLVQVAEERRRRETPPSDDLARAISRAVKAP